MILDIMIGIVAGVAATLACTAMVCGILALVKVTKDFLEG